MKTAKASLSLNYQKIKEDGTCPISVEVYYQRVRRRYFTGVRLREEDFENIKNRVIIEKKEPLKKDQNLSDLFFIAFQQLRAAEDIINKKLSKVFSFSLFEQYYVSNYGTGESIVAGFTKYINELREDGRVSSALTYESALRSLESFRKGMKFPDINSDTLKKYEKWMLDQNNSKATIGFYLRSLRSIFNQADLDRSIYPFGKGRNKYTIPTGRNIKKALHLAEIAQIFNYEPEPGSEAMAKDYWIFMYLCNGMNLKDLCRLKGNDINGDFITFKRAKTANSQKDATAVVVSLKPEAKTIISKWGQISLDPDEFVFPHLSKSINPQRERDIIQLLTKLINKYMKRIGLKLQINKPLTTYVARHSFATVLKRSGASTEMISDLLRHSSTHITQNYLDGFESEQIHAATEALTDFSKVHKYSK